ncbi:MAG TPA: sigma-70 family RNA polymerase sigma factor [Dictyoglomaceae bacterium]|nr:sigma-70 family RNA polymerase sigma factor [Dictyoglomaceae bacterium]
MISTAKELWERYKKEKDEKALIGLLEIFDDLIYFWASKFTHYGEPFEDLVQVGYLGFLKAIENYDPEKGELSTYISHCVLGEIKHYLRDKTGNIRIPKTVKKLISSMDAFIDKVWEEENRYPTIDEIAKALNIKKESVKELFRIKESIMTLSIEELGIEMDKIKSESFQSFRLPVEDKIALESALSKLPEIQRKIIEYIFYQDLTQGEVAKILKISQSQVSRLFKNALSKLKELI